MILEKSCGAVIYNSNGGEIRYLVEKMRAGHYSICKGHMEGDETETETAIREIREETSLSVRFIDGFREVIEYSPYPGCMKEVVFFLAEADSIDTVPQECEVSEIRWLPFDDAYAILTHDSDKGVLAAADRFLKSR